MTERVISLPVCLRVQYRIQWTAVLIGLYMAHLEFASSYTEIMVIFRWLYLSINVTFEVLKIIFLKSVVLIGIQKTFSLVWLIRQSDICCARFHP